ncbi:unnamed protein product [Darwinula stevensoni]|uniref:Uncharacterized protein n=1 Tax=Darwinula stevensoni TaxID=69355 RepID=A0A7R8XKG1_9CRUS|nr:unnamed protein product [Darwinula stevensoni]CAG0893121.1 unnamed protein product [Darwinula stevensoni]
MGKKKPGPRSGPQDTPPSDSNASLVSFLSRGHRMKYTLNPGKYEDQQVSLTLDPEDELSMKAQGEMKESPTSEVQVVTYPDEGNVPSASTKDLNEKSKWRWVLFVHEDGSVSALNAKERQKPARHQNGHGVVARRRKHRFDWPKKRPKSSDSNGVEGQTESSVFVNGKSPEKKKTRSKSKPGKVVKRRKSVSSHSGSERGRKKLSKKATKSAPIEGAAEKPLGRKKKKKEDRGKQKVKKVSESVQTEEELSTIQVEYRGEEQAVDVGDLHTRPLVPKKERPKSKTKARKGRRHGWWAGRRRRSKSTTQAFSRRRRNSTSGSERKKKSRDETTSSESDDSGKDEPVKKQSSAFRFKKRGKSPRRSPSKTKLKEEKTKEKEVMGKAETEAKVGSGKGFGMRFRRKSDSSKSPPEKKDSSRRITWTYPKRKASKVKISQSGKVGKRDSKRGKKNGERKGSLKGIKFSHSETENPKEDEGPVQSTDTPLLKAPAPKAKRLWLPSPWKKDKLEKGDKPAEDKTQEVQDDRTEFIDIPDIRLSYKTASAQMEVERVPEIKPSPPQEVKKTASLKWPSFGAKTKDKGLEEMDASTSPQDHKKKPFWSLGRRRASLSSESEHEDLPQPMKRKKVQSSSEKQAKKSGEEKSDSFWYNLKFKDEELGGEMVRSPQLQPLDDSGLDLTYETPKKTEKEMLSRHPGSGDGWYWWILKVKSGKAPFRDDTNLKRSVVVSSPDSTDAKTQIEVQHGARPAKDKEKKRKKERWRLSKTKQETSSSDSDAESKSKKGVIEKPAEKPTEKPVEKPAEKLTEKPKIDKEEMSSDSDDGKKKRENTNEIEIDTPRWWKLGLKKKQDSIGSKGDREEDDKEQGHHSIWQKIKTIGAPKDQSKANPDYENLPAGTANVDVDQHVVHYENVPSGMLRADLDQSGVHYENVPSGILEADLDQISAHYENLLFIQSHMDIDQSSNATQTVDGKLGIEDFHLQVEPEMKTEGELEVEVPVNLTSYNLEASAGNVFQLADEDVRPPKKPEGIWDKLKSKVGSEGDAPKPTVEVQAHIEESKEKKHNGYRWHLGKKHDRESAVDDGGSKEKIGIELDTSKHQREKKHDKNWWKLGKRRDKDATSESDSDNEDKEKSMLTKDLPGASKTEDKEISVNGKDEGEKEKSNKKKLDFQFWKLRKKREKDGTSTSGSESDDEPKNRVLTSETETDGTSGGIPVTKQDEKKKATKMSKKKTKTDSFPSHKRSKRHTKNKENEKDKDKDMDAISVSESDEEIKKEKSDKVAGGKMKGQHDHGLLWKLKKKRDKDSGSKSASDDEEGKDGRNPNEKVSKEEAKPISAETGESHDRKSSAKKKQEGNWWKVSKKNDKDNLTDSDRESDEDDARERKKTEKPVKEVKASNGVSEIFSAEKIEGKKERKSSHKKRVGHFWKHGKHDEGTSSESESDDEAKERAGSSRDKKAAIDEELQPVSSRKEDDHDDEESSSKKRREGHWWQLKKKHDKDDSSQSESDTEESRGKLKSPEIAMEVPVVTTERKDKDEKSSTKKHWFKLSKKDTSSQDGEDEVHGTKFEIEKPVKEEKSSKQESKGIVGEKGDSDEEKDEGKSSMKKKKLDIHWWHSKKKEENDNGSETGDEKPEEPAPKKERVVVNAEMNVSPSVEIKQDEGRASQKKHHGNWWKFGTKHDEKVGSETESEDEEDKEHEKDERKEKNRKHGLKLWKSKKREAGSASSESDDEKMEVDTTVTIQEEPKKAVSFGVVECPVGMEIRIDDRVFEGEDGGKKDEQTSVHEEELLPLNEGKISRKKSDKETHGKHWWKLGKKHEKGTSSESESDDEKTKKEPKVKEIKIKVAKEETKGLSGAAEEGKSSLKKEQKQSDYWWKMSQKHEKRTDSDSESDEKSKETKLPGIEEVVEEEAKNLSAEKKGTEEEMKSSKKKSDKYWWKLGKKHEKEASSESENDAEETKEEKPKLSDADKEMSKKESTDSSEIKDEVEDRKSPAKKSKRDGHFLKLGKKHDKDTSSSSSESESDEDVEKEKSTPGTKKTTSKQENVREGAEKSSSLKKKHGGLWRKSEKKQEKDPGSDNDAHDKGKEGKDDHWWSVKKKHGKDEEIHEVPNKGKEETNIEGSVLTDMSFEVSIEKEEKASNKTHDGQWWKPKKEKQRKGAASESESEDETRKTASETPVIGTMVAEEAKATAENKDEKHDKRKEKKHDGHWWKVGRKHDGEEVSESESDQESKERFKSIWTEKEVSQEVAFEISAEREDEETSFSKKKHGVHWFKLSKKGGKDASSQIGNDDEGQVPPKEPEVEKEGGVVMAEPERKPSTKGKSKHHGLLWKIGKGKNKDIDSDSESEDEKETKTKDESGETVIVTMEGEKGKDNRSDSLKKKHAWWPLGKKQDSQASSKNEKDVSSKSESDDEEGKEKSKVSESLEEVPREEVEPLLAIKRDSQVRKLSAKEKREGHWWKPGRKNKDDLTSSDSESDEDGAEVKVKTDFTAKANEESKEETRVSHAEKKGEEERKSSQKKRVGYFWKIGKKQGGDTSSESEGEADKLKEKKEEPTFPDVQNEISVGGEVSVELKGEEEEEKLAGKKKRDARFWKLSKKQKKGTISESDSDEEPAAETNIFPESESKAMKETSANKSEEEADEEKSAKEKRDKHRWKLGKKLEKDDTSESESDEGESKKKPKLPETVSKEESTKESRDDGKASTEKRKHDGHWWSRGKEHEKGTSSDSDSDEEEPKGRPKSPGRETLTSKDESKGSPEKRRDEKDKKKQSAKEKKKPDRRTRKLSSHSNSDDEKRKEKEGRAEEDEARDTKKSPKGETHAEHRWKLGIGRKKHSSSESGHEEPEKPAKEKREKSQKVKQERHFWVSSKRHEKEGNPLDDKIHLQIEEAPRKAEIYETVLVEKSPEVTADKEAKKSWKDGSRWKLRAKKDKDEKADNESEQEKSSPKNRKEDRNEEKHKEKEENEKEEIKKEVEEKEKEKQEEEKEKREKEKKEKEEKEKKEREKKEKEERETKEKEKERREMEEKEKEREKKEKEEEERVKKEKEKKEEEERVKKEKEKKEKEEKEKKERERKEKEKKEEEEKVKKEKEKKEKKEKEEKEKKERERKEKEKKEEEEKVKKEKEKKEKEEKEKKEREMKEKEKKEEEEKLKKEKEKKEEKKERERKEKEKKEEEREKKEKEKKEKEEKEKNEKEKEKREREKKEKEKKEKEKKEREKKEEEEKVKREKEKKEKTEKEKKEKKDEEETETEEKKEKEKKIKKEKKYEETEMEEKKKEKEKKVKKEKKEEEEKEREKDLRRSSKGKQESHWWKLKTKQGDSSSSDSESDEDNEKREGKPENGDLRKSKEKHDHQWWKVGKKQEKDLQEEKYMKKGEGEEVQSRKSSNGKLDHSARKRKMKKEDTNSDRGSENGEGKVKDEDILMIVNSPPHRGIEGPVKATPMIVVTQSPVNEGKEEVEDKMVKEERSGHANGVTEFPAWMSPIEAHGNNAGDDASEGRKESSRILQLTPRLLARLFSPSRRQGRGKSSSTPVSKSAQEKEDLEKQTVPEPPTNSIQTPPKTTNYDTGVSVGLAHNEKLVDYEEISCVDSHVSTELHPKKSIETLRREYFEKILSDTRHSILTSHVCFGRHEDFREMDRDDLRHLVERLERAAMQLEALRDTSLLEHLQCPPSTPSKEGEECQEALLNRLENVAARLEALHLSQSSDSLHLSGEREAEGAERERKDSYPFQHPKWKGPKDDEKREVTEDEKKAMRNTRTDREKKASRERKGRLEGILQKRQKSAAPKPHRTNAP